MKNKAQLNSVPELIIQIGLIAILLSIIATMLVSTQTTMIRNSDYNSGYDTAINISSGSANLAAPFCTSVDKVENDSYYYGMTAADSLVAFYPMDENNSDTTKDYGTSLSDGTVSNATWTSSGKYGGAYSFSNDTYQFINITSVAPYVQAGNSEAPFTICMWTYLNDAHSQFLYSYRNVSNTSFRVTLGYVAGAFRFTLYNGTSFAASGSASALTWNHVCAIKQNAYNPDLYINGINQTGTSSVNAVQIGSVLLGTSDVTGTQLNGTIDEVKIWNVSLTAEQILTEYNAGSYLHPQTWDLATYNVTLAGQDNCRVTASLPVTSLYNFTYTYLNRNVGYNTTGQGILGMGNLSSFQVTWAVILAASVVIGLVGMLIYTKRN
jgi:hypothetical protein